jgi:hypothetical protein
VYIGRALMNFSKARAQAPTGIAGAAVMCEVIAAAPRSACT